MAVAFCFLSAKTDEHHKRPKKWPGRDPDWQSSGDPYNPEMCDRWGVLTTGTRCRQKEALCLEVAFDAKVIRA